MYLPRLRFALIWLFAKDALACHRPYSVWMADSVISRNQAVVEEGSTPSPSTFLQLGFFQDSVLRLINSYHSPESVCAEYDWEEYLESSSASIAPYLLNATEDAGYPLDRLSTGKGLTNQYELSHNRTALSGLHALRASVDLQNTNQLGGYWYYKYPYWSYLDGMYSVTQFLISYASHFGRIDGNTTDNVIHQLDLLWKHCYHNESGLLVHGYDSSKTASWANPVTGASPIVWDRSLGWYFLGLVDSLEISSSFPERLSKYLQRRLNQLARSVISAADSKTGCWWQVMTRPNKEGNYIESSGSAMFTTALFRAARLGYLPEALASQARESAGKCYSHLVDTFVVKNANGTLGYNGTVSVCSLDSAASYDVSCYIGDQLRSLSSETNIVLLSTTSRSLFCITAFMGLRHLFKQA